MLGFVCLIGVAQAKPEVYHGMLGTMPVVMELNIRTDGKVQGRYFSPAEHVTHSLYGSQADQGLLVLTVADDEDATMPDDESENKPSAERQLTLHAVGEQGWNGEWRDGEAAPAVAMLKLAAPVGSTAVVKLSPFMQSLYALSMYDFLFQQGYELKMAKEGVVNGYHVEWWQDPLTHFSMFQVISGYPAAQREQLNAQLRDDFWQILMRPTWCGDNNIFGVKIGLLSPNVASYIISGQHSCPGAAHPTSEVFTRTFRVSDTTLLSLSDLLWVGKRPVPDEDDIESDYLENTFPGWLKKQFDKLYPVQMSKTGDTEGEFDGCDYSSESIWVDTQWYLTRKGIYFQTMMPNMLTTCNDSGWEVLPWKWVNQHRGRLQDLVLP
ncbi:hypothetical protein [Dickeya zeae]|uniref:hypothetical protein n=1 Tax=Dickeya zeae TaxID=204042 RepID=UPI001F1D40AA|nr:hypothetical protein [Dickeya zeae]